MEKLEKRTLVGQQCELRASEDGAGAAQIFGYGAVFNTRSQLIFGSFVEIVAPGAFDDVLNDDVRALFNHDPNFVLGRTRSGTLQIGVDETGLRYTISPPDTQTVRDLVMEPLRRGDVTGSSFAFRVGAGGDRWEEAEDGLVIRTITRFAELYDVCPVTYPAYDATSASKRMAAWKEAKSGELHRRAVGERDARARFLDLLTL